jgi:hypothetical protein
LIPLPNKDGAAIARRYASSVSFYRPASPGAWALLDQCFFGDTMAIRNRRVHRSIVGGQIEEADQLFDKARTDFVNGHYDLLSDDPVAAVAGLETTSLGCLRLIEDLERALNALQVQGYWRPGACGMVVRLFGFYPEITRLRESALAYRITLDNLYCQPGGAADEIAMLNRPEFQPPELAARGGNQVDTSPAACRERLQRILEERLMWLRVTEEDLRTGRDARRPDQVLAPNMMIVDEAESRHWFRYFTESRSTLLRCLAALKATLKEDAARAESKGGNDSNGLPPFAAAVIAEYEAQDSPAEATATAPADPRDMVSPTEPDVPAVELTEISFEPATYVAEPGVVETPVEPGERDQEPPIPTSDGRFLVRASVERLEGLGLDAPMAPKPTGGSGPPSEDGVRS